MDEEGAEEKREAEGGSENGGGMEMEELRGGGKEEEEDREVGDEEKRLRLHCELQMQQMDQVVALLSSGLYLTSLTGASPGGGLVNHRKSKHVYPH